MASTGETSTIAYFEAHESKNALNVVLYSF